MKLRSTILRCVALLGATTVVVAQEATGRLPWHGDDGPLVRADGSPWRPDDQVVLALPRLNDPVPFRVGLPVGGEWIELDLVPYSLRSPEFRILVSDGGELREVEPPPPRTYRGTVVGHPDARVTASLDVEGRMQAFIDLGTSVWYVRPLSDFVLGADAAVHAVSSSRNAAVGPGGTCGVVDGPHRPGSQDAPPEFGGAQSPGADDDAGSAIGGERPEASSGPLQHLAVSYRAAGIVIHVRPDYYSWAGGSTAAVLADIDDLMNNVQREYDEGPHLDVFKFNLIGVFIETSSSVLTSSDDKDLLIDSLVQVWTSNGFFGWDPDFVHLLTTELGPGGTIGYGAVDSACNTSHSSGPVGFAISETDFASASANPMKYRAWLTAHELGHNLGANHDSCGIFQDTCQIMCPGVDIIGCALIGISWSTQAADSVNNAIARSCFDGATGTIYADGGLVLPFPDGTASLPFGSISAALPHVEAGWTLALYPSSFDESVLVLDQLMTITAVDGPATIE